VYSETVREHYVQPRNSGRIINPSASAMMRSPVDTDTILVTLQIENGIIEDIKFKCMGCAVAIASSSMATEMVRGKHVDEASQITKQAVADALGGIPQYKMLCSNLAPDAIKKAIDEWRIRQATSGHNPSSK
jgi:nitrogen fixation protein NifU and related proteins